MSTFLRSDSRLVAQVLRGRRDRFEPLVLRYLPAVRAIAYYRLGNMSDVEDAAQDTFVTAYENLRDLREPAKFGPWLMAIARRRASRVSAGRRKEMPLSPEHMENTPADTPDLSQREIWSLVREHLEQLPEAAREVLLLHYFAGQTTREIAGLLGIRQAAVLKRLQRAREQLGVSLVATLADGAPAKTTLTKHAARISALATASAIHSVTSGGAAAAATSGMQLLLKGSAAVVAAAALSAGAMFFALSVPANHGESATQRSSGDVVEPAAIVPAADVPLVESPEEVILVAQAATSTTGSSVTPQPVSDSPTVGTEPVDAVHTLDGLWRARVGDDKVGLLADYGYVEVTQSGYHLEGVLADTQGAEIVRGSGALSGNQVSLLLELEGDSIPVTGEVNADWSKVVLRAKTPEPDDGFPSGVIRIELQRADQGVVDRHLLVATFRNEVQAMFDALRAWRAEHEGIYPDPAVAEGVYRGTLPSNNTRREIVYTAVPTNLTPPAQLPAARDVASNTTFYPNLPLPDRLVRLERALREHWNGGVATLLKPVLAVRYPDERIAYNAYDSEGVVETPWNPDEAIPVAQLAALRASCANNMKQLGIASKMFEKDVESYYPPGFNALYPQYIVDPRILRCPTKSGAVISYEFMFPAMANEYLMAIGADYFGVSVEAFKADAGALGEIPFLIETHDCAGRPGDGLRLVLFLDGHVEVIKPDAWKTRIVPFFDYR